MISRVGNALANKHNEPFPSKNQQVSAANRCLGNGGTSCKLFICRWYTDCWRSSASIEELNRTAGAVPLTLES